MSPRTIEQIRADHAAEWSPPDRKRATILDPAAGECAPLFTSARFDDCLTHLTRYIADHPTWSFKLRDGREIVHEAYLWATGWCGVLMSCRQIPLADATGFVCAKCLERAGELGLDTFGMIPDTGCAVSGGKRGRKTPNQGTDREAVRTEGDARQPTPAPGACDGGDSQDVAGAVVESVPASEGAAPGVGGPAAPRYPAPAHATRSLRDRAADVSFAAAGVFAALAVVVAW